MYEKFRKIQVLKINVGINKYFFLIYKIKFSFYSHYIGINSFIEAISQQICIFIKKYVIIFHLYFLFKLRTYHFQYVLVLVNSWLDKMK